MTHKPSSGRIGVPVLPIKRSFIRAALDLIIEASPALRSKRVVSAATPEDNISWYLNREMKAIQRMQGSDLPRWECKVGVESPDDSPPQWFEIDFKFLWTPSIKDAYLAVEAKKLFGKGDSRAGKYVDEGLMDFVNGKYSMGHDHAVMLGYVLVPPVDKAISHVADALESRAEQTRQKSAFSLASNLCTAQHTHHSQHLQVGATSPMTVVHVFLDLT